MRVAAGGARSVLRACTSAASPDTTSSNCCVTAGSSGAGGVLLAERNASSCAAMGGSRRRVGSWLFRIVSGMSRIVKDRLRSVVQRTWHVPPRRRPRLREAHLVRAGVDPYEADRCALRLRGGLEPLQVRYLGRRVVAVHWNHGDPLLGCQGSGFRLVVLAHQHHLRTVDSHAFPCLDDHRQTVGVVDDSACSVRHRARSEALALPSP